MPDATSRTRALLLLLLVGVASFGAARWLAPLELAVERVLWTLASDEGSPPVVLVEVDAESLERNPDPLVFWGPTFGQTIEALERAGATAVGLDFLFEASGETFFHRHELGDHPMARTWDVPLRAAVARGRTVLVSTIADAPAGPTLRYPMSDLAALLPSAGLVGHDTVGIEQGVVRWFLPATSSSKGAHPSFALALARLHGSSPDVEVDEPVEVAWGAPVPRLPLWRVAEGGWTDDERDLVNGRVVVIGHTHPGSTDVLGTPFGTMPGAEVQARLVAMLIEGRRVHRPGTAARAVLLVMMSGFALFAAFVFDGRWWAMPLLVALVVWPVVVALAWTGGGWLLPMTPVVTGFVVALVGAGSLRYLAEQERRRATADVFGRFVSPEVMEWALASPDHLELGGEEMPVTVLFSDVRGFTTLSERLAPEELVDLLNGWLDVATRAILAEGGVVDKFIGDGIMAVFGAPVSVDDHPERAVRAGVAMMHAAAGYAEDTRALLARYDLPAFAVGVGVYSGSAVAGNVGTAERLEYTFIGDAVNVSARIEGLTKAAGVPILVGSSTFEALPPSLRRCFGLGEHHRVKGRQEPVLVYPWKEGPR